MAKCSQNITSAFVILKWNYGFLVVWNFLYYLYKWNIIHLFFCYILNSMDVMDIFVLSNNLDVQYSLNIPCIFLKFIYHRLVIKKTKKLYHIRENKIWNMQKSWQYNYFIKYLFFIPIVQTEHLPENKPRNTIDSLHPRFLSFICVIKYFINFYNNNWASQRKT